MTGMAMEQPALPLIPASVAPQRAPITGVVVARFNTRVVHTPTCWFWVGAIAKDGYGRFNYARSDGSRRAVAVHRFAFEVAHGTIAASPAVLMHKCNEPSCVRVGEGHVVAGTSALNNRHAVASGRHRGPRQGTSDPRGPRARSVAIREVLRDGYDAARLTAALNLRTDGPMLF